MLFADVIDCGLLTLAGLLVLFGVFLVVAWVRLAMAWWCGWEPDWEDDDDF